MTNLQGQLEAFEQLHPDEWHCFARIDFNEHSASIPKHFAFVDVEDAFISVREHGPSVSQPRQFQIVDQRLWKAQSAVVAGVHNRFDLFARILPAKDRQLDDAFMIFGDDTSDHRRTPRGTNPKRRRYREPILHIQVCACGNRARKR